MTMTAPQQEATPSSEQASSALTASTSATSNSEQMTSRQKLQRCCFMAMGLLGGLGFVMSQMSYALAATDFLAGDHGTDASELDLNSLISDDGSAESYKSANESSANSYTAASRTDSNYSPSVVEPSFVEAAPAQSAAEPTPVSETFIEVPAASADSVTSSAGVPTPSATQTAQPAATQAAAVQAADVISSPSQSTGAQSLDDLRQTALESSEALTQTPPALQTPTAQAAAVNEPGIEIEITPAIAATSSAISPTVTPVSPPRFTHQRQPEAPKIAARKPHPLAGLIDASAVAAPLSAAYASHATDVRGALAAQTISAQTNGAQSGAITVAMADELSPDAPINAAPIESAPEVPATAVPDILPEPAAPIGEVPPAAEAAPLSPTAIPTAEAAPSAIPEGLGVGEDYESIFVDPTDYSIGATEAPSETPNVVISEQSTGCEFTVGQSQSVPNGACGLPNAPAPVANGTNQQPAGGAESPVAAASEPAGQATPVAPVASSPSVNVGPVTFSASGIQLSTSAAGREYLNRSIRPLVNLQATREFIFPLAVPSPITSLFGFRVHPIFGDWRFHSGTDIGAEQGTPVLAAQDGVVTSASEAGGYGLMVVLRHQTEELELESRYAHLAEMFVEPGTVVKKGDIIGLVGSTGNSTGPHLHFEMHQKTADGWVVVNADGLIQASLSNLIGALNNPMETLTFNLSDFNLSNLRSGNKTKLPTTSIPTFPVGEDGIPFRPAQPNAS